MEKQFKPVPDCEELRYKGTPENPDIKIFVSHRIDQDSETIDNPLYIPVRCGAVYDERENVTMLGDDTGDNISEKRNSYCELTVQYWAWKNVKADYYGLCHYRRYIGFGNKYSAVGHAESNNGCIVEPAICEESLKRNLLQEHAMRNQIEQYDIIAIDPILIEQSNYQAMQNSSDYHNMRDVDNTIKIIKTKYPEMARSCDKYMNISRRCFLYNCWIMSAHVFNEYCAWLFDVLSELEKLVDGKYYSQKMLRIPGTIGERLFGIYLTYIEEKESAKIKYQPLVFFNYTGTLSNIQPYRSANNIAIASNFDDNYTKVFSVLLQSIIDHSSVEYNYDIIILSQDISQRNMEMLQSMINKKPNFSVRSVNVTPYLQGISKWVDNAVYTADVYTRVLIPHILSNYQRVLVLDADMVCEQDISKLFFQNLNTKTIAAVKDVVYQGYLNGAVSDTKDYAENVLKLTEPYNYCNTGVLVFDCDKARKQYSLEYLRSFISTHEYRIYEQDMLNVLYDGQIDFLPPNWNTFTYTNNFVKNCVALSPYSAQSEYTKARNNPYILHFAAHPKPWWVGKGDYSERFWYYARRSPFYEEIIALMINQLSCTDMSTSYSSSTVGHISNARKLADIVIPKGSKFRAVLKKIMPKNSPIYNFFKYIYYAFGGK